MDSEDCKVCKQPAANCGKSDRTAVTCDIRMTKTFRNYVVCPAHPPLNLVVSIILFSEFTNSEVLNKQAVPCYFKVRMDELADKWLLARKDSRKYDLNIVKLECVTYICGPYWRSLLRDNVVVKGDVLKLECVERNEENDLQHAQGGNDATVSVTFFDSNGEKKESIELAGTIQFLSRWLFLHGCYLLHYVQFCAFYSSRDVKSVHLFY